MQIHRFTENIQIVYGQVTAATSGTAASAIVDCLGYRRAAAVYQASISGTGSTADCKLQESTGGTSGSTWTDVTGGTYTTLTATSTGAAATAVQGLNIDLAKRSRYLRLLYTGAGSTNTGYVTSTFYLLQPEIDLLIAQTSTAVSV